MDIIKTLIISKIYACHLRRKEIQATYGKTSDKKISYTLSMNGGPYTQVAGNIFTNIIKISYSRACKQRKGGA